MAVLKLAYFVAFKISDYWFLDFPYFRSAYVKSHKQRKQLYFVQMWSFIAIC